MVDNKNYHREPNFWIRGRRENKKFYEINLKRITELKTFVFGLLLSSLLILPIGLMLYQYIVIYGYDAGSFGIYLTVVWIAIMLFNGLSNYITVKICQSLVKDMDNLQKIEAGYIFLYQILNPIFGLVTLIIIVFGAISILGAIR